MYTLQDLYDELTELDYTKGLVPRKKYIVIHHSLSPDTKTRNWDAIRAYHMSWRYDGESISEAQAQKLMAQGKKVNSPDCFSYNTEVLTNNGWKIPSTIAKSDLVFTVEDGFTSNYKVNEFEKCEAYFVKTLNYSGHFSSRHKLIGKATSCCTIHSQEPGNIVPIKNLLTSSARYYIQTSLDDFSNRDSDNKDPIALFKLIGFTVGDGCIYTRKDRNTTTIQLAIVKNREVNYLQSVLRELNWKYSHRTKLRNGKLVHIFNIDRKEYVSKIVSYIGYEKKLRWGVVELNKDKRLAVLQGYLYSDGCTNTKGNSQSNKTYQYICGTDIENLNILQALAHLSGFRTKMTHRVNDRGFAKNAKIKKELYTLSLNPNTYYVCVDGKRQKWIREDVPVWTIDAGGKRLLIRHNQETVQITHNSDIAYSFGIEEVNGQLEFRRGHSLYTLSAHATGFNTNGFGICVIGNYDIQPMPKNKYDALVQLCQFIRKIWFDKTKVNLKVIGHRETYPLLGKKVEKSCPGNMVDLDQLRRDIYGA